MIKGTKAKMLTLSTNIADSAKKILIFTEINFLPITTLNSIGVLHLRNVGGILPNKYYEEFLLGMIETELCWLRQTP